MTSWQKFSRCLSLGAAVIGALSLTGWVAGIPWLTRLNPAWVTMKANTAISLILLGCGAALLANLGHSRRALRVAQGMASLVFLTGFLTLLQYIGGWDFGIDQALFKETQELAGRSFRGRMGPASALILMALSGAILTFDVRLRRAAVPSQVLVIVAGSLTMLIFLSYFYNVELPPFLAPYFSIALHTVAAFLMLCGALLFARPREGFMAVFLADDAGGALARRLLPAAFALPSLAGWLFVMGREHGLYGRGVAAALLAVTVVVVFTWLIWSTARAVGRTDQQRRKAEAGLLTSQRQLADFFDNAAVALHRVGPDGTILHVNDTELTLLGYAREEYLGKNIADIHVDPAVNADMMARLTAGEVLTDYPARLRRKDGSICDVLVHSSVYRENGKFIHTRCFTRDVTEMNRTAEALRHSMEAATVSQRKAEAASRAKDDFLAALSHELRTPLTPVLLTASDLKSDPSLPEDVRAEFEMISKNVSLEARLIDDLLDLTRITRGKLGLSFTRVDLHKLLTETVAMVRPDMADRTLTIRMQLEAARCTLQADATRLHQVCWNLLKNAVKFTPDGGVITIATSNPAPGLLTLTVTDSGRGIAPEMMDRIFDAFDQGELNGRHVFGGLGLGLAISRAIVQLHGGRLTAASEGLHQGASFTVELPEPAAAETAERPAGEPAALSA